MTIIGIDLSINNTGICVYKSATQRLKESFNYYIIGADSAYTKKNLEFIEYLDTTPQFPDDYIEAKNVLHYQIYRKDKGKFEESKTTNIHQIVHRIELLIKKYKPDLIVLEGIGYGANSRSLADLAGLHHVVRYVTNIHDIEIVIIPPTELKKLFVGRGNATKDEMTEAFLHCDDRLSCLSGILKLDDVADAYALVSCAKDKELSID